MFVFPMAGLSSRFTRAGFRKPKFMLDAGGRTLFEHSIAGFQDYFDTQEFLFVYLDTTVDREFIEKKCNQLGMPRQNILTVALDSPTDGQATTVAEGVIQSSAARSEPLTIFNIDTIYRSFRHPNFPETEAIQGYLDVFEGEGDHWSFVRPDVEDETLGRAAEVVEKRRISNLCSSGLYHFQSAGIFLDEFARIKETPAELLQGRERYIAPLYNDLIERGGTVYYRKIDTQEIQFSGTPEEYLEFTNANGWEAERP